MPIRLTNIPLAARSQLRIREMGLRVGAEGVVSQHAGYGGLILTIAGARIAIDHRSAQLIEAEVLN
ncbi:ferrous iron transport protein A [Arcanobacterium haemolyticum]|uniref:ferrous iron transport protein A n=1 Tax=Arcanobacterium haemolyticum TaxID=28264 RepID=UPI000DE5B2A7|nr:ferrous iron transport protein A [Arcanobacterium haemolyticum]